MMVETAPPQSSLPEAAPSLSPASQSPTNNHSNMQVGTILEGAFIDPAYSWPPAEGEGKNAVEIVSKPTHETSPEEEDLSYPEVPKIKARRKVVTETEIVEQGRCFGLFRCCKTQDAVVNTHTETIPVDPAEKERLRSEYLEKRDAVKKKRKERRRMQREQEKKYPIVPEGVLIYRLDTSQKLITLISAPNSNTDMANLMTEIVVADASPSRASNRRGIILTGENGETFEIVACEQRTATSWMETLNMMLGKEAKGMKKVRSTCVLCLYFLYEHSSMHAKAIQNI